MNTSLDNATQESTAEQKLAQAEVGVNAETIRSLRLLADYLEENPTFPATVFNMTAYSWNWPSSGEKRITAMREGIKAAARCPGPWTKQLDENTLGITSKIGNITLRVEVDRAAVCQKVKVVKEVDEWQGGPILSDDEAAAL